ncbi:fatty acid desaturase family protein [Mycolicibacterium setense]|uniref:fatty acid desaturase family protein n=1 Tax=Mycolicibacterium setense TaxID=431269 RepID=UPI000573EAC6|nr:fatty acid desaturase [Mycolicibacterium setense]KHO17964.1 fatty acid desaturase [Mycolicibacterium setense]MCV7112183.1 fatty acid desaturase [Mycolicibacterium setense]
MTTDIRQKAAGSGSKDALGISMAEARSLIADLTARRRWIYWADLIACVVIGYAAFLLCPADHLLSPIAISCMGLAALAFYRAVLFVHEIVHAPEELRRFSVVWHVVCGIPLLVPQFTYEFHQEHHGSRTYGTAEDGEYVPYATEPRWRVIALPFTALLGPLVFVLRFLVLAPLSWLVPRIRPYVLTRASALMIDADFVRKLPEGRTPRSWLVQEFACFVYLVAMLALLVGGVYSPNRLAEAYVIVAAVLFVNWIRVLAAHRYESRNERMTIPEQVLDSIDHPSMPILGELWAPLGLRYHAVHHLFPKLPYHQLGKARRRLAEAIPRDGGFWTTEDRSLTASLRRLLAHPREAL